MKNSIKISVSLAAAALVLCAVAASVPHGWAQRRGGGTAGTFDPLGRLKRALSEAGAAALTSAQEDKINSLITDYRTSHTPPAPGDSTVSSARTEYDNDILNGDSAGAAAQAAIIAGEMTSHSTTRLKDEAKFAIDVIAQLRTNDDQVGALQKRFGTDGVVRLVISLVGGGPGGFGRGGPPPGFRP